MKLTMRKSNIKNIAFCRTRHFGGCVQQCRDGQLLSIVAPGNITTSFGYDEYGRQTSIDDPSAGLKIFNYDAAGNPNYEKYTESNGDDIIKTRYYDQYGRITSKSE